jgi:hypothetical protein
MATKQKMREFKVYRYWPVEYRSIAWVKATTPEEAARLALEDDDYSDAESCDDSDGPTEVGQVIEITPDGLEIEHNVDAARGSPVPAAETVGVTAAAALIAALKLCSGLLEDAVDHDAAEDDPTRAALRATAAALRQCK